MFDEKTGMNRSYGTKWFTFYTKVRPCFVIFLSALSVLGAFMDLDWIFSESISEIIAKVFLLIMLIVDIVLSFIILFISEGHYGKFVKFVKGVLAYDLIRCSLLFAEIGFLVYFVWYRPNVKYFERRLSQSHAIRHK